MITAVSAAALEYNDLIIKLATQFRLPVVYAYRVFAAHGGLTSYATDIIGQYKRPAGYVDRILKGEKPADLPVQMPTKYVRDGCIRDFPATSYCFDGIAAEGVSISFVSDGGVFPKPGSSL
jgi:hypothetical protein